MLFAEGGQNKCLAVASDWFAPELPFGVVWRTLTPL